jgi:hypothetical protein
MTTCRDIVTLALRQARIVGIGRTPRAAESDEGMIALQSLYDGMFADGPLGPFTDVYATSDYTAQENERIIADGATITVPDTIEEKGKTRTPKDLSAVIVVTDTTQKNYVFSLGRWQVCDALTLDSEAPLANRNMTGLSALLAMHYCEMFGAQLPPMIARIGIRFKGALSHKVSTAKDPVEYF